MNRKYFENTIQSCIEKYGDLESVLEMNGENLDEIVQEIYHNVSEGNIERELINTINSHLCKQTNRNLLQTYFDEVGYIYQQNNNNTDIEFCEENRSRIIEMNLKNVVKIAKSYRSLGVAFEDLISAGNEGLCVAFDKYKPGSKTRIREDLLSKINTDSIKQSWIIDNIKPLCKYGKLKKSYEKTFIHNTYKSDDVIQWIKTNIKDASFNSVAMMWVQAYIRAEITNNGRLIKKSLNDIKKEKTEGKDIYYDLSSPVGMNDENSLLETILVTEGDVIQDIDIEDAHSILYDNLKKMLTGLELRHKRIIMERFGIGLVRPMKPDEIAIRENISKARVSQIIRYSLEMMRNNCVKYNIQADKLYSLLDQHKELF